VTVDGSEVGVDVGSFVVLVNIDGRPLIAYHDDDAAAPALKTAYGG